MTEGNELAAVKSAARKLAESTAKWTTRRDEAIRAACSAGHSQRQIAAAADLSHPTVATITRTDPKES